MRLEQATFRVKDIVFSNTTRFSGGVLYVSKEELRGKVLQDSHFIDVEVNVARPGDNTRIINILDAVEPRHKVSGPGTVFPAVIGPTVTVGQGRSHRLEGMALITTGVPSPGEGVYWRDGIIDMWGAGARYTPFSSTIFKHHQPGATAKGEGGFLAGGAGGPGDGGLDRRFQVFPGVQPRG